VSRERMGIGGPGTLRSIGRLTDTVGTLADVVHELLKLGKANAD